MSDWSDRPPTGSMGLSYTTVEGDRHAPLVSLETLINFVRGEQGPLLRFLTWKVRCPSAAADLIQELYLRIVTLAKPEGVRNPRYFL